MPLASRDAPTSSTLAAAGGNSGPVQVRNGARGHRLKQFLGNGEIRTRTDLPSVALPATAEHSSATSLCHKIDATSVSVPQHQGAARTPHLRGAFPAPQPPQHTLSPPCPEALPQRDSTRSSLSGHSMAQGAQIPGSRSAGHHSLTGQHLFTQRLPHARQSSPAAPAHFSPQSQV